MHKDAGNPFWKYIRNLVVTEIRIPLKFILVSVVVRVNTLSRRHLTSAKVKKQSIDNSILPIMASRVEIEVWMEKKTF